MPMFRKKPVVVEAWRWRSHMDCVGIVEPYVPGDRQRIGVVVPDMSDPMACAKCGNHWNDHGLVKTLEDVPGGAHLVCPGDFIIKGVKGEFYACKPDIFQATYEPVTE